MLFNLERRKTLPGSFWLPYILATICTHVVLFVSCEKTAADYYVARLPGQPEGPLLKMHAGYVILHPTVEPS